MADVFNAEQRQVMYQGAEAIGGILRDRFHTKQAEDFTQNELQTYFQLTAEFNNALGTMEDGDTMAMAFRKWQQDTTAWTAAMSAKYSNNPKIMGVVKNILDQQMTGLDNYMKVEQYGNERSQRAEKEKMGKQKFQAELGATEALTEQRKASATESRARAAALSAEIKEKGFPTIQANAPLSEVRNAVRNLQGTNPALSAKLAGDADNQAIARIMQLNRGKEKPDGNMWGADPDADWKTAQALWLASPNRTKMQEAYAAKQMGYDLNNAKEYYSDVVPSIEGTASPLLPGEMVPPLQAGAGETNLIARSLGTRKEDLLQRGYQIDTVEGFTKDTLDDLPLSVEGYRMLGKNVVAVFEGSVKRDADGQVVDVATNKQIHNSTELRAALMKAWRERGTDTLVDPGATALKEKSNKLGAAIIAKYLPVIASRLGMRQPGGYEAKKNEGILTSLIRNADKAVGPLLKGIGFGYETEEPY